MHYIYQNSILTPGELRNDALFKTMTADLSPLSSRADEHDHALMYPEYTQWLSTQPTSAETVPKAVEVGDLVSLHSAWRQLAIHFKKAGQQQISCPWGEL
jgi:hypothetical protein